MAVVAPPPARYRVLLGACVVGLTLLVVAAVYGRHGLIHLLRLRSEQRTSERIAFELQEGNELLRQRIRRLRSDDAYIEKLARERLGLARQGEIVYRVAAPTPRRPPLP